MLGCVRFGGRDILHERISNGDQATGTQCGQCRNAGEGQMKRKEKLGEKGGLLGWAGE